MLHGSMKLELKNNSFNWMTALYMGENYLYCYIKKEENLALLQDVVRSEKRYGSFNVTHSITETCENTLKNASISQK